MQTVSERRRRTTIPAGRIPAGEGWISLVGQGSGFHDCPLCRELRGDPEAPQPVKAIVDIHPASLPELIRAGWIDDLVELVGPNATVRVMGREMEAEPVEVISMETFLARLGYE